MDHAYRCTRLLTLLAAALVLAAGCDSGVKKTGATHAKKDDKKDEEEAPHGGTLFAIDSHKYHAELLVDKSAKKATVYFYDKKVKNAVPTSAKSINLNIAEQPPVQIALPAEAQGSDPAGNASRFSGTNDRLAKDLDMEKVEIDATIEGKPYVFKLDKD
jgi:hypothetical protein